MRLQQPRLWVPGSGFKTLLMDDSFPAKPPAMRARCVVVVGGLPKVVKIDHFVCKVLIRDFSISVPVCIGYPLVDSVWYF